MEYFIPIGYGISLAALLLFTRAGEKSKSNSKLSVVFGGALILFGLYPRVLQLNTTSFGLMLFEELSASLDYVNKMASGEQTWTGATQMVYFLAMDAWRFVFGMEAAAARALSCVFGLASLLVLFLGFRRLVPAGAALLASGLMAFSLYGSFFSRLAIEPGWTVFFFALNVYFFARIREGRRGYFLLGLSTALGLFTYPGYTIWLISLLPFLAFAVRREWKSLVKPGLYFFGGAALFTVPTLIFHFVSQGDAPLFRGGGILFAEQNSYWQSLLEHLEDIFWSADSYYLIFPNDTFVESTLWGFFAIGVWRLVWRERRAWAAVLLGSMILLPFISAAATNYPGMRRALLFLPVFYAFAAVGIDLLLRSFENLAWKSAAAALTLAALALPSYALVEDLEMSAVAKPFDKWAEVIQHPQINEWLEKMPVRVIMATPEKFSADYMLAYVDLLKRYRGIQGDFQVMTPAEPVTIDALKPGVREFWIFNSLPFAQKLMNSGRVCLYQTRRLQTNYFPMFATEIELRGDRKVCP
jgi:hypothetical protein